jgi:xanthine dehydrogenase accessory factor
MHAELLQMASELARREEAFVLAVVVRRRPASSAQAGDMAVITAGGEFHGWLGGSCTQPTVVREAQLALADGKPRLLALSPDPEAERRPGVAVFPMTCHSGGSVEIYLEPILPAPRLAVFGESPTARALLKLATAMGYSVGSPFGGVGAAGAAGAGASAAVASSARCFAVVATMGEGDEDAIRAALALRPAYLGVVASAKRFAQLRQTLLAQGVPDAALDSIRSPAGVAIGAQTPEEIAISVLAEIVERRHAAAAALGAAEAASPAQAIDPICGMTVDIAGARHTAEAGGRTWYFCSGGCRERFLAAPERAAALGGVT